MTTLSPPLAAAALLLTPAAPPFPAAPAAPPAPPHVIAATPDHGDAHVDPSLALLSVTFDQDMSTGGFSWVGGPPMFPETTGPPQWLDARTCVLPVRLDPDREYRLSINSPQHANFRSAAGEPAPPYPIWFRTAPAPGAAAAPPDDSALRPQRPEDDAAALDALRRAIDERYSYRDRLGLDWDALFAAHRGALLAADTPYAFAARAGRMLAAAEDPHVSVTAGGTSFPVYLRSVTPNCNLPFVASRLTDFRQRSPEVFSGRLPGGVGYICIATWQRDRADAVETAFDALRDLADTPALVVDVRANGGGDEMLAQRFAGCFVREPVAYARHVSRDPDAPGGFSAPITRVLQPNPTQPRYDGPVVVLMGPLDMSSSEAFLLMMKQTPNATLIGARSAGSSGNPQPARLPNGVVVMLPSWKAMRLDGTPFEGVGIAPDIELEAPPQQFQGGDPVLERAQRFLADRRQPVEPAP